MKINYTPIILGEGINFAISYASNIEAAGLGIRGMADPGMTASRVTVVSNDLAGQEDDTFNNKYWMQVIQNSNSAGNPPEEEIVQISDYISATGTFTLAGTGFSVNVESEDELLIIHEVIVAIGRDTSSDEFDSSNILANADGTILQRLEDLKQTLNPVADWTELDREAFDVLDADANTERWDVEYLNAAVAGGDADINDTTSGKLYVKSSYNVGGVNRYAVSKALPIYADFFNITEDLSCTWGSTDSATAKAIGIGISAGSAYDANNYIFVERQKGTGIDRIQVRSVLNGAGEVTTNAAITYDVIAFKIERLDQTWRVSYSLLPEPDQTWVLISQIEDPSNYLTNEVSFYQETFNGANTDSNETAQGDFDNFFVWVGSGGGAQFLVGNYDSSYISAAEADIDGNLFERDEATLQAIQVVAAGGTGFESDGSGATIYKALIAYEGLTTSGGTIRTIVDSVLTALSANDLIGCQVIMLEGNNAGQSRTIKSFDGTDTITVDRPWLAATSTTSGYVVLTRQGSIEVLGGGTLTTSDVGVPADTGRGEADNYWDGCMLMTLTGVVKYMPRYIVDYDSVAGEFTLDDQHQYAAAPGLVAYVILPGDGAVSLIPSTDASANETATHVGGSKADTPIYKAALSASSMRYLKGILKIIAIANGTFDTSSLTIPADSSRGEAADYWNGNYIMTTEGASAWIPRLIVDFTTGTGVFTLDPDAPYAVLPGESDYIILPGEIASLIPDADGTSNYTIAHVEGSKADVAVYDHTSVVASNIALVKGILGSLVLVTGTVSDVGAATTDFDTDLAEATNNHYNGALLVFTDGDNVDESHTIYVHTAANGNCAFAAGDRWTAAPGNGDTFSILSANGGFLIKLYQMIAGADGIAAFPAAADIANGVSLAEAVRAILTSIVGGDDYDNYTNIANSANVSLDAIAQKFATVIGIATTGVFDPTIRGVSCTTFEQFLDNLGIKLENLQPSANSIDTIYNEVHTSLDLAETDATTLTLDATEQTMYEENDTVPFSFSGGCVDLFAMAVGDIVRFRVYTKCKTGGTYRKISNDAVLTFRDAQTQQPGVPFGSMIGLYGIKLTIEHTLVAGAFDVDCTWYDAKAGN